MNRTNAVRLVLASGVLGGFVVGWGLSRLVTAPPAEPTPPAVVTTDALEPTLARADTFDRPTPVINPAETTPKEEPATEPPVVEPDAVGTDPAAIAARADDIPAFSRPTAIRRSIARGRVNRGVRRLFGLPPAPRRSGGRAVRHVTTGAPAIRVAVGGAASPSVLRSVAHAVRSESLGVTHAFGTSSTLTTESGARTSALSTFDGTTQIAPKKLRDGDAPNEQEAVGACCLSGIPPHCIETIADTCTAAGGVFLGADANCEQRVVPNGLVASNGALRLEMMMVSSCPREPETFVAQSDKLPLVRIDPWVTAPDDGLCGSFWSLSRCAVPAGFFGPGSQPLKTRVCLRGVPLDAVVVPGLPDILDFGIADTLIRRTDDPFDRCHAASPDPVSVGIALERMQLEGVTPLEVTFDGSTRPDLWNLRVEVADGSRQPEGVLTAYKEHPNGGRFDASFAFCPTLVFSRFDDPRDVRVFDYCTECDAGGIVFETRGNPWIGTIGSGLALPNPVPTEFHPGVRDTGIALDADCNENGFLDSCDIGDSISFDRNDNGVPDECECAADLDASGDVGFGDLAVMLLEWGPCGDGPCAADLDGNGVVEMNDVFQAIRGWGACK